MISPSVMPPSACLYFDDPDQFRLPHPKSSPVFAISDQLSKQCDRGHPAPGLVPSGSFHPDARCEHLQVCFSGLLFFDRDGFRPMPRRNESLDRIHRLGLWLRGCEAIGGSGMPSDRSHVNRPNLYSSQRSFEDDQPRVYLSQCL